MALVIYLCSVGDNEIMDMVERYGRRKLKYHEKNVVHWHLARQKFHMDRPGMKSKPLRQEAG
jgi:hypothetical protein